MLAVQQESLDYEGVAHGIFRGHDLCLRTVDGSDGSDGSDGASVCDLIQELQTLTRIASGCVLPERHSMEGSYLCAFLCAFEVRVCVCGT